MAGLAGEDKVAGELGTASADPQSPPPLPQLLALPSGVAGTLAGCDPKDACWACGGSTGDVTDADAGRDVGCDPGADARLESGCEAEPSSASSLDGCALKTLDAIELGVDADTASGISSSTGVAATGGPSWVPWIGWEPEEEEENSEEAAGASSGSGGVACVAGSEFVRADALRSGATLSGVAAEAALTGGCEGAGTLGGSWAGVANRLDAVPAAGVNVFRLGEAAGAVPKGWLVDAPPNNDAAVSALSTCGGFTTGGATGASCGAGAKPEGAPSVELPNNDDDVPAAGVVSSANSPAAVPGAAAGMGAPLAAGVSTVRVASVGKAVS